MSNVSMTNPSRTATLLPTYLQNEHEHSKNGIISYALGRRVP